MEASSAMQSLSALPSVYDTILCTEPAGDADLLPSNDSDEYTALLRTLQRSADYYAEKDQMRTVERLQFEMVRLHMQNRQWQRAMRTLVPLWQTLTWRQAGWWGLLGEVDWALKTCARNVQDFEMLAAVEWELMSRSLTSRQESCTNFDLVLDGVGEPQSRPKVTLRGENVLSCLSSGFAFEASEGNVGEPLESQFVLGFNAHSEIEPITISEILVTFEGSLKDNQILHKQLHNLEGPQKTLQEVELKTLTTPGGALSGSADITLTPGCVKVLALKNVPREAGEIIVKEITIRLKQKDFDLELIVSEDQNLQQDLFWRSTANGITSRPLKEKRSRVVRILPKPPKIRIGILNLLSAYFVDEHIVLDVVIANEEEEAAEGVLDVRLSGPPGTPPKITWDQADDGTPNQRQTESFVEDGYLKLPPNTLASLSAGKESRQKLWIYNVQHPTDYTLRVECRYSLASDPETLISKMYTTEVYFVQPFDLSAAFNPIAHPDPWPNYFDASNLDEPEAEEGNSPAAAGLTQRWSLISQISNVSSTSLRISSIVPVVHQLPRAVFRLVEDTSSIEYIAPDGTRDYDHVLDVQFSNLEDRSPTDLDLALRITYTRAPLTDLKNRESYQASEIQICTLLPLSPLHLSPSEPRVLAALLPDSPEFATNLKSHAINPRPVHISYTIENPSTYNLPFTCAMETPPPSTAASAFAFSGPKSMTLHLLPLSRRSLTYTLLPLLAQSVSTNVTDSGSDVGNANTINAIKEEGVWLYPVFRVVDTAFSKRLRVLSTHATSNDGVIMRTDTRRLPGSTAAGGAGVNAAGTNAGGVIIWVPFTT